MQLSCFEGFCHDSTASVLFHMFSMHTGSMYHLPVSKERMHRLSSCKRNWITTPFPVVVAVITHVMKCHELAIIQYYSHIISIIIHMHQAPMESWNLFKTSSLLLFVHLCTDRKLRKDNRLWKRLRGSATGGRLTFWGEQACFCSWISGLFENSHVANQKMDQE